MTPRALQDLAWALGGNKAQRAGSGWVTFCPVHDNTRTPALSLNIGDNDRLLVRCHGNDCDGATILDVLRSRGLIKGRPSGDEHAVKTDSAERERQRKKDKADERDRTARALALWEAAVPASGTAVERYLKEARGIDLKTMPATLRFHPAMRHPTGECSPAMVALVQRATGEKIGIHRTFLKADGSGKAALVPSKAMLGPCSGGGVWFGRPCARWSVGEGIESSLSFASAAVVPICAALSTSGMAGLDLPACPRGGGILIVASDGDGPGRKAAATLVSRARGIGWQSAAAFPPENLDFNDLLLRNDSEERS